MAWGKTYAFLFFEKLVKQADKGERRGGEACHTVVTVDM